MAGWKAFGPAPAAAEREANRSQDDLGGSSWAEANSTERRVQPFRFVGLDDEVATAPKQWVVEGILAHDEIAALIGQPFAGKSALAVDLAGAVAAGTAWFGHATTHGAVLYVAGERWRQTVRRFRAWRDKHGVCPAVAVTRDPIDLMNEGDVERLIETAAELRATACMPVRLIVIDTVRSTMVGDENAARDMSRYVHALARLRDSSGAHVMVLHHTPMSDPNRASGHTTLSAAVDALLVLSDKQGRRHWHVKAANDLVDLPAGVFVLGGDDAAVVEPVEPVKCADSEPQSSPLRGDLKLVYDAIASVEPCAISVARQAVYKALGARTSAAKRRAFLDTRKTLVAQHRLAVDGTGDDAIIRIEREREDAVRKREDTHGPHVRREREAHPPLTGGAHVTSQGDDVIIPAFLD